MMSGGNIAVNSNGQNFLQWIIWTLTTLGTAASQGCASSGEDLQRHTDEYRKINRPPAWLTNPGGDRVVGKSECMPSGWNDIAHKSAKMEAMTRILERRCSTVIEHTPGEGATATRTGVKGTIHGFPRQVESYEESCIFNQDKGEMGLRIYVLFDMSDVEVTCE